MPIVKIRLSDKVHEQMKQEAKELGMTLSGLGSSILGNYLRQRRELNPQIVDALVKEAYAKAKEDMEKHG